METRDRRLEYLRYLKYSWIVMEVGVGLFGSAIAGYLIGGRLDARSGGGTLYAALFAIVGVAVGLANGYRALRALEKRWRRKEP